MTDLRDKIIDLLAPDLCGSYRAERKADAILAILPDYEAQQARIDKLALAISELLMVQAGLPMTGIEATQKTKQARAALKGEDT